MSDILLQVVGLLATLIVSGLLLLVAIYLTARGDRQATFLPEGEIKFIVRGEHLHRTLANVRDHVCDEKEGRPIQPGERHQSWLERRFGIRWVSILYPLKRVHGFTIQAAKIISQDPEKPLRQWIQTEDRFVKSLRWRFPRPIIAEGVELGGDRSRVDIMVLASFQVMDPYMPVFVFKGGFFPPLEDAVRAAIVNVCGDKKMRYKKFVAMEKGPGSDFANKLLEVNTASTEKSKLANGIIEELGIEMFEVRVFAFDLAAQDKEFKDAARAKELEKLKAEAEEQRGIGERKRLEQKAAGEKARWFAPIEALVKELGVDKNIATSSVGAAIRRENTQQIKQLTTLVEGVDPSIAIPIQQQPTPKDKEEKS